jgi:four helix bundle protein
MEHGTWNMEHRTLNVERPTELARVYDLEERLLEYSMRIIRLVEALPNTRAGNHVAGQLLRSGTAALPNHGEAQAGESRADFIHKMKVCLKELRESLRWLKLVQRVPLVKPPEKIDPLLQETDELIRIFVKSIQTSQERSLRRSKFKVER